jgi:hypothetical protein
LDTKEIIKSQYRSTLKMLEEAIINCPDTLWDHPTQVNKFWHTAFHTLFYTHLYLQTPENDFTPWSKHERDFTPLGDDASPDDRVKHTREPYIKSELLEYLELCLEEVSRLTVFACENYEPILLVTLAIHFNTSYAVFHR